MGAAVVMAVFASQQLGPTGAPVTAKGLVGKWELVGSSSPNGRGLDVVFRADGTRTAVVTPAGRPPAVVNGAYAIGPRGRIRVTCVSPDGTASTAELVGRWAAGGRLRLSVAGSDGWNLMARVPEW